jgi:hypothetical protein
MPPATKYAPPPLSARPISIPRMIGAGTRTSSSAKAAPAGGFGGVMVTRARNGEVPLGGWGNLLDGQGAVELVQGIEFSIC